MAAYGRETGQAAGGRRGGGERMSGRARRVWQAIAIVVAGIGVAALLVVTRPRAPRLLEPVPPVHVRTVPVLAEDVQPERWLSGTLRPSRRAVLHFEIAGRLVERLVEPGRSVEAGQTLLRIDDRDQRDALREAEARLSQEAAAIARDRKVLALVAENRRLQAREVDRLRRLHKGELASGSQLEISEQKLLQLQVEEAKLATAVATAESRRTLAAVAVERARRALERTVLVAPFAGRVDRVLPDVGDYLTPSLAAVEVVVPDPLDLYLEVDSELAAVLRIGQVVETVVDGVPTEGRIVALRTSPEARTGTYPLRIRRPAEGAIPGRLARARLPSAPLRGALTVPVTSLLRDEGRAYLFVVDSGRLRRLAVRAGPRTGGRQVVFGDGLAAGVRVVGEDVAALADDQPVVVENRRDD